MGNFCFYTPFLRADSATWVEVLDLLEFPAHGPINKEFFFWEEGGSKKTSDKWSDMLGGSSQLESG